MAFNIDFSENNDLIPEGTYECIIREVYEDATKGGTVYINIPLVIRNDVEQKRKNAYLWHSIWKKKEPTARDKAVGGYNATMINRLSEAAGLTDGSHFETLEEWMQLLKDRPVKVTVRHELNSYNNQMQVRIGQLSKTSVPECRHEWKTPSGGRRSGAPAPTPAASTVDINVDDDDLPFN